MTAASTIAASTGCGRFRSSPDAKSTTTSVKSAATSPDSGVRAPALFVDQRLRHAAAHWKSAAEAGDQIGGAEREEFLVGVEAIPVLLREHPADGGRFDGREDEARQRQRQQRDSDSCAADDRQPQRGQALRARRRAARRRAPRGSRPAPRGCRRRTTKNATGRFFSHSLPSDEQREGADADHQRRTRGVAEVPQEIRRALPEIAVRCP